MGKTWKLLNSINSTAKRYVVCSDDDPTIDEYRKLFGKDTVVVFSKEEAERTTGMDLMDCYYGEHNNKKGTVWARNIQYKLARQLGYRWFMMFDDDYITYHIKNVFKDKRGWEYLDSRCDFFDDTYDKFCLKMFDVLNSTPWLYTVASPQAADYTGGVTSQFVKNEYKFKAMNVFWFDCEKEMRFYGRLNDDVSSYVLNGSRGELSLTMFGPEIRQLPTQQTAGGMTDIYKYFGTYMKSLYSSMIFPSGVYLNIYGGHHYTMRIHHMISWKHTIPKIIDEKFCKGKPLDYITECIHDNIKIDENFNVIPEEKIDFSSIELVEGFEPENSLEKFF